jgi:hypothetical protein
MCLLKSNLDIPATITIIYEIIRQEEIVLQTHRILNNETASLQNAQRVAHLKNLLCLLRRCGYSHT